MKYVYEVFDDTYGESLGIFATSIAAAKEISKRINEWSTSLDVEFEVSKTRSSANIKYEIKQHEVKE